MVKFHGMDPLYYLVALVDIIYLGEKTAYGKVWNASDAQLLVFEGLLTSNLINKEYTIAGHDKWDQTISCYFSIISPIKNLKFMLNLDLTIIECI